MWIWALIGAVITLIACFGSTQPQPKGKTKTTITMNGHRRIVIVNGRQVEDELDELEEWDLQDHLEELEEEE